MRLRPIKPTEPVTPREEWNRGEGDHDQVYRFGRRPSSRAPFPFSMRQYARLLVFKSRVQDRPEERTAA